MVSGCFGIKTLLFFLILGIAVLGRTDLSHAQKDDLAPGLTDTPAEEMDFSAVNKELNEIGKAYHRRTDLVQLMANGTLMKFYKDSLVPCGQLRTSVSDCLNTDWKDLKDYRKSFFQNKDGSPKLEGFSPEQVVEIKRSHLDMVDRLNTLLVAVRYEDTLKPETRYEARLAEMLNRLEQLEIEEREAAELMQLIVLIGTVVAVIAMIAGAIIIALRVAKKAKEQAMDMRAQNKREVDDY